MSSPEILLAASAMISIPIAVAAWALWELVEAVRASARTLERIEFSLSRTQLLADHFATRWLEDVIRRVAKEDAPK